MTTHCLPTTNPPPSPSTFQALPSTCLCHLPPFTFHQTPLFSTTPTSHFLPHTIHHGPITSPHLTSTIYQPPPSSMIHFYLLYSTMLLDCSQPTFLALTFQHLLSSLPILPFHHFVITRFHLFIIYPGCVFLFKYSQLTIIQTM